MLGNLGRPRLIDKAASLLGPLEARIMTLVWENELPQPFTVRDLQVIVPELAYTTLMTTAHRLAEKGLLNSTHFRGVRAHQYRQELSAREFLRARGGREIDDLVARYGETALVAFAAKLQEISPERRERLRKLAGQ